MRRLEYEVKKNSEALLQVLQTPQKSVAVKFKEPEDFHGNQKGHSVNAWLMKANLYFAAVGMPEPQKVLYAVMLLKGNAYTWWRNQVSAKKVDISKCTWSDFEHEMLKEFTVINSVRQARDKIKALKQKGPVNDSGPSGWISPI